jgi:hypothetical protein
MKKPTTYHNKKHEMRKTHIGSATGKATNEAVELFADTGVVIAEDVD